MMPDQKLKITLSGRAAPEAPDTAKYNCRLKIVTDAAGSSRCIQRLWCDRHIFNDGSYERRTAPQARPQPCRLTREQMRSMSAAEWDALQARDDPNAAYKAALSDLQAELASNETEYLMDHPEEEAARRRESIERSARRARGRVMDYVLADYDLCYFVTLTLNGEAFDRDDRATAFRKLRVWLNNRVQRSGLKYVFVPELHSDGRSVHFHGFINNALALSDSGTVIRPDGGKPVKQATAIRQGYALTECRTVFNVPDWVYGYSTAVKLYGERLAAARYAAKYVTKEVEKLHGEAGKLGGRWYWSSNNLKLPQYVYCDDDFEAAPGAAFVTPAGVMKCETCDTEFCMPNREAILPEWAKR